MWATRRSPRGGMTSYVNLGQAQGWSAPHNFLQQYPPNQKLGMGLTEVHAERHGGANLRGGLL